MFVRASNCLRLVRRAMQVWKHQGTAALVSRVRRRLDRRRADVTASLGLQMAIDQEFADPIQVGGGTLIHISGWCFHPHARIRRLSLLVGELEHPITLSGYPRGDVYATLYPKQDPKGLSFRSGFGTLFPIAPCSQPYEADLAVRAELANGEICTQLLRHLRIEPGKIPAIEKRAAASKPGPHSRVTICMTTYNPAPELFTRQIRSIQEQTHRNWTCILCDDGSSPERMAEIRRILGDDDRFQLHLNKSRLGFFRNFEKCLSLVPGDSEFVAFSDHDDHWHADKLESLLAAFEPDTLLAYSDMNIVGADGTVYSNTYWTTRPNSYDKLASLLVANTVTGAASLFRTSLLKHVLPFPPNIGTSYHDHWIACVALCLGKIAYVDRALYDYVQHGGNVIGHCVPPRRTLLGRMRDVVTAFIPNTEVNKRWRELCTHSHVIYIWDMLRIKQAIGVIRMRCGPALSEPTKATMARVATVDSSPVSFGWLCLRGVRNLCGVTETIGSELRLLQGIAWKNYSKLPRLRPAVKSDASAEPNATAAPAAAAGPVRLQPSVFIEHKIAALKLDVRAAAPRRVNLLIPEVDFQQIFGGYITKFNLARCLAKEGYQVRIITVDESPAKNAQWKKAFEAFQGLEDLLDHVTFVDAFDRRKPIEVSPQDAFIATTWWTAHVAHQAARTLGHDRFVYLIQEYEPFIFSMGTYACLADESYTLPHYAVFSSELLREYFRANSLGVFSGLQGEEQSTSFQNTITNVGELSRYNMEKRSPRRLLFYARPESHNARNLFEIGIMALTRALEKGYFRGPWTFSGIGATQYAGKVYLTDRAHLELLPRQSQDVYADVLRNHDLGLSLMYTPHPSLVPIEMASAGMPTVTNTFCTKTHDRLQAISRNLIAVEPTADAITEGLRTALARVERYDERLAGADVQWATTWGDCFNPEVMSAIQRFIQQSGDSGRPQVKAKALVAA